MGNAFIGLPLATLQSLQTAYVACLTAIASNQSYALNGRSLTRANLGEVQTALANINAAIALASGTASTTTFVSFTGL